MLLEDCRLQSNWNLRKSIEEWSQKLFNRPDLQYRHLDIQKPSVVLDALKIRYDATWIKGSINSQALPKSVSVLEVGNIRKSLCT